MHVSGNNMNMEIIIMGHGHFASGLYSTLELIGGEQEHVAWIDFTEDKDMDGLLEEMCIRDRIRGCQQCCTARRGFEGIRNQQGRYLFLIWQWSARTE